MRRDNDKSMTIDANLVKTALMAYCRFKRGWVCANEVWYDKFFADVLCDTGTEIIEIEVKVRRSDLLSKESIKEKHYVFDKLYRGEFSPGQGKHIIPHPNRFFICVPTSLVEEALDWCERMSPAYGVMELLEHRYKFADEVDLRGFEESVVVRRSAKKIHSAYRTDYRHRIMMRLSTVAITLMKHNIIGGHGETVIGTGEGSTEPNGSTGAEDAI